MDQDNTQGLEEKLQQQVSSLLSRRFSSIESEVQRLQTSINEFCERLLTYAGNNDAASEELAGLSAGFRQTLSAETEHQTSQAVAAALARAEDDFRQRLSQAQAEAATQINELRAQIAVSQQAAAVPDAAAAPQGRFDLLRDAFVQLDEQKTQAEALTILVNHASQFASRVVFFVLKGGNAIGWKAVGFSNGLNDETVRSLISPIQTVPLLRQAVTEQRTASASDSELAANVSMLGSYGESLAAQGVAIPLTVRNKVAAVLYADSGNGEGAGLNTEALESLLHFTSLVVELLPVRRNLEQARPVAPPAPPPPQPEIREPEPTPARVTQEVAAEPEETTTAPAPPVFYGGLGDEASAQAETPAEEEEATPAVVTVLPTSEAPPVVTPATIAPESPSAFVPAQTAEPAQEPVPPSAAVFVSSTSAASSGSSQRTTSVLSGNASEAEVTAHNNARRFARLLVSEIKLYNEARVADGRRNNDLYERLKEDIDRSRQMYEKRVSPTVAAKYDYFYDELVHTLAEGDSAKLGHGCPGPTVPAS